MIGGPWPSPLVIAAAAALAALVVTLALLWGGLAYPRRAERRFPPLGRRVQAGGALLHVIERGPADAAARLVLLHGAAGNAREFLPRLAPALEAEFRLIVPDRPGAGYSPRPKGGERLGVQGGAIASLIQAMGAAPAILVGHSLGAAVALRVAIDHPGLVRALVLIAPAACPFPGPVAWFWRFGAHPILGPLLARLAAANVGPLLLGRLARAAFKPAEPIPGYGEAVALSLALRPRAFRAAAREVAACNREFAAQAGAYENIHIPVRIVTGDEDAVVSPKLHAFRLAETLPDAEIITLPGVGHLPHQHRPDVIAALVRRLSAIGAARPAG